MHPINVYNSYVSIKKIKFKSDLRRRGWEKGDRSNLGTDRNKDSEMGTAWGLVIRRLQEAGAETMAATERRVWIW